MFKLILKFVKIFLLICLVAISVSGIVSYFTGISFYQEIIKGVIGEKQVQPEINKNQGTNPEKKDENTEKTNKSTEKIPEVSQPMEDTEDNKSNLDNEKSEDYFLTGNEINSIDNIDLQDKLTGLAIISKINKSDLQKIYKLADGGITTDELKELKKILDRNLSKSEMDKLDDLLIKNRKLFAEGKIR